MPYQKSHIAKKSLAKFIIDGIQSNSDYIIGDGATNLKFFDAFPIEPAPAQIPAISMDYTRVGFGRQYDLGNEAIYNYDFIMEIFSRNNLERELIAGLIVSELENSIPLIDYNSASQLVIGYLKTVDLDAGPIRVESPSGEEKYKFFITMTLETRQSY